MLSVSPLTAVAALAAAGALSFVSAQDDPLSTATTLVSLHSTNPTAVPLTSIDSTLLSQSTVPIQFTATPGVTPSISGAPPIPTWAFSPTEGYPALDAVPPTNSTQVQQWIAEVAATGIQIPNIPLSKDGSCASDPAKVANASYCWWTCGGCTRDTDVTTCPDKMTWGLTYDDGPSPWTTDLLNYLDENNLKTTFFVVGSRAISRPDILQAEYAGLHHIADHTWSHPYLTTLSNDQIIAELGWTRKAIKDITGVTPLYMRPPYGDIDDRVRAICKAMNLTPVMWSNYSTNYFDTEDWHIPLGYSVDGVIDNFENILNNASVLDTGFIVLEHDLYPQTVDVAIGYVLPDAMARKDITFSNVIECLHKPLGDAYLETNNNASNPLGSGANTLSASSTSASMTVSTSGTVKITATLSGNAGQTTSTTKSGGALAVADVLGMGKTLGAGVIGAVGAVLGAAVAL
ncbi:glycoside hydrolase/deacetylase [Clavulina sp. PMI_390]|nr:glycoside hydrolase/deacetylase [Clavulina sp. PMI_390]